MIDTIRLVVAEYDSVTLDYDQLTDSDIRRLTLLQNHRHCTLSPTRTGWRFRPEAIVGVLTLDHVRVTVTPKTAFTGRSLIQWLSYALHTPVPHESTVREWTTATDGFVDLVAAALLAECRALLRDGLRRDYVRTEHVGPVLRGRLDVMAQATQRFGQLDRLHMRTFDRDLDIWENQLCGHALRAAAATVTDSQLARTIRSVAAEFPFSGPPSKALRAHERARYTHLNRRYRAAHTWAALVLRGGGVSDLLADTGFEAGTLLLDLPRLWEKAVRRLCEHACPPSGIVLPPSGSEAITVHGDLFSASRFRPDVLVRLGGADSAIMPIDAKYKAYQLKAVSAADVHQILTYIAGHAPTSAPVAAIVYPRPDEHSHRILRINGPGRALGEIRVLGVGADSAPAEAAAWLRSMLWSPH
ncbi:McrC family protein [Nocardia aurea]|uniref:McrC family protein n=1 Tax=Nocardia aurea TaxID=2144174 RepID=UPI000D68F80C|nr:PE-PGRS family protein [Nocardia aurea]